MVEPVVQDPQNAPGTVVEPAPSNPQPVTADPTADPTAEPTADPTKPDPTKAAVTPQILNGVLDAQKRTFQKEMKSQADAIAALNTTIQSLQESISSDPSKKSKGKDGEPGPTGAENQELIELRRQVDNLSGELSEERKNSLSEKQLRRDGEFRNKVLTALQSADCHDLEAAFLVIKPKLQQDPEDAAKIFANVDTKFGIQESPLKDYIEREFKENVCPYLFRGKVRQGSPAAGDGTATTGTISREQAFNAAEYAKDPDKHRHLIQDGKVRGMPKPGEAVR